jgi:WD40 repeat protein
MRQIDSRKLDDRGLGIHLVKYSPLGDRIVGAGGFLQQPGHIAVWDAGSVRRRTVRVTPGSSVTAIGLSHDQRLMASDGEHTDSVEIWETDSYHRVGSLPVVSPPFRRSSAGHLVDKTRVGDLVFSEDRKFLAAGCWDTTAKVWEMDSRARKESSTPDDSNADFIAILGDGSRLAVGTWQTLTLWDFVTGSLERRLVLDRDEAWRHLASLVRGKIFSISHKGRIRVWDALGGGHEESRFGFRRNPCAWAYFEFSDLLAIGFDSGEVIFWPRPTSGSSGGGRSAAIPSCRCHSPRQARPSAS